MAIPVSGYFHPASHFRHLHLFPFSSVYDPNPPFTNIKAASFIHSLAHSLFHPHKHHPLLFHSQTFISFIKPSKSIDFALHVTTCKLSLFVSLVFHSSFDICLYFVSCFIHENGNTFLLCCFLWRRIFVFILTYFFSFFFNTSRIRMNVMWSDNDIGVVNVNVLWMKPMERCNDDEELILKCETLSIWS